MTKPRTTSRSRKPKKAPKATYTITFTHAEAEALRIFASYGYDVIPVNHKQANFRPASAAIDKISAAMDAPSVIFS